MRQFSNPARISGKKAEEIYPYYAGFSKSFAEEALAWATKGNKESVVLDPWNGAGTTTRAASHLGFDSVGFDLNPVMVLVAKCELLDPAEAPVLLPLAKRIIKSVRKVSKKGSMPLDAFFDSATSHDIAELARSIWLHLVAPASPKPCRESSFSWEDVAPLAGTYFVALFNSVRRLLHGLVTSNPTWLRVPRDSEEKICVSRSCLLDIFFSEMEKIHKIISVRSSTLFPRPACLALGDSRSMRLADLSVNAIVTSPPYCTRLDYGRATMPELLILESIGLASYAESRHKLMGTATARKESRMVSLGPSCDELLEKIRSHPSKASGTYYYQSHLAYFNDLAVSMREIARVRAPQGRVCMVVQDSYYKDIHNDLPKIVAEMASLNGLGLIGAFEYKKAKSMCGINKASLAYRAKRTPFEVALLLNKE